MELRVKLLIAVATRVVKQLEVLSTAVQAHCAFVEYYKSWQNGSVGRSVVRSGCRQLLEQTPSLLWQNEHLHDVSQNSHSTFSDSQVLLQVISWFAVSNICSEVFGSKQRRSHESP